MKYSIKLTGFNLKTILCSGIYLVVAILCCTSVNAQEVATLKKGVFEFETEVVDYGTVKYKSDGMRTFNFKNVGTAPIIISKVKATCGCTVPKKPKGAIMPGETASIEVKYATDKIGSFSKTITVTSNASKETVLLKIKGKVLPKNDMAVTKSN